MKTILLTIIIMLSSVFGFSQNLYIQTFGDSTDAPLIFLHGGPGYNCASFEVTTAEQLSKQGYYVIAYDRRGEGRSLGDATYTFEQTHLDIITIMDSLNIKSSHLIGHSFGGMVAVTFAEHYKERVRSIVLVGAPVALQESFKTIISSSEKLYTQNKDDVNLSYLNMLAFMDSTSLEFSSYCFMHAMQNGFYSPSKPTKTAKKMYKLFKSDTTLIKYSSKMSVKPPQGFWENEAYTTMNMSTAIDSLVKSGFSVFGMYGKEDGLYSEQQVDSLKAIIGNDNLLYLDNCSHSVFIDQQKLFLDSLKIWLKYSVD